MKESDHSKINSAKTCYLNGTTRLAFLSCACAVIFFYIFYCKFTTVVTHIQCGKVPAPLVVAVDTYAARLDVNYAKRM